jgi:hypothetical protein
MSAAPVHHTDRVVVDTERLGRYVRERRERQLGLSRDQIFKRGGPSTATQRNIENNLKPGHRYRSTDLVSLARALDWTDDSLDRILEGDEPAERPATVLPANSSAVGDDWEIVAVQVKPGRKLSDAERAVVEADMLAAAHRALLWLEEKRT